MNDRTLLSPPDTGPAEEEAVLRALRSGWVAPLGPEVDAFEREIADYTGRRHAVALSSGTAALHLALLNWGIGPGDVVITATMTFVPTANAIVYTGAIPVFVDCDETGNIDIELFDHAVQDQLRRGARVRAILPVDILGKIANYEAIAEIADRAGVPVISDAAEFLGATRNAAPAGSFGDAAIVSFNGNKVMTTSGGGMLLTDDANVAARTRCLATQARQPVIHYGHIEVGYNYRLSNLLAALGRAQLSRLSEMIDRRRQHRVRYRKLFAEVQGTSVLGAPDGANGGDTTDNFWLTSVLADPHVTGWTAEQLVNYLAHYKIEARPLWKPIHLQPIFTGLPNNMQGTSERLFLTSLSLPSGSRHGKHEMDYVTRIVSDFLAQHKSRPTTATTALSRDYQ